MPKDVHLGEGYTGDALMNAFPNEYRSVDGAPDQAVPGQPRPQLQPYEQPQNYQLVMPPGNQAGQFTPADPDRARPLELQEIPGVGQVAMPMGSPIVHNEGGMASVLPTEHTLAGPQGMGQVVPVDHEMADWRGGPFAGMGGITEAVASLVAGPQLDKLNKTVMQYHDKIIEAYKQLDETLAQQKKAAAVLQSELMRALTPTMGISFVQIARFASALPMGAQAIQAVAAVKESFKALTGFDFMNTQLMQTFNYAANQLGTTYVGFRELIPVMGRWTETWVQRVAPKPGMRELKARMVAEHGRLYAIARPGAPRMDPNDPMFLQTAAKAVSNVLEIKSLQNEGSIAGMGNLGADPVTIGAVILALVKAIAIIGVVVSAVALAKEFNVKAHHIYEMRRDYENRMEAQRREYTESRKAEGASAAQAEREWQAIKEAEDKKQIEKEDDYSKKTGWSIGQVLTTGVVAVGSVYALTQLL
jgi:hypothetical protein